MADIYVDSNATGGADGSTWADAYTTLANAISGGVSAGDVIWVAHNHAESTAATVNLTWPGLWNSQANFIICANSGSGEPPSTLATTATAEATGTGNDYVIASGTAGQSIFVYGITFKADDRVYLNGNSSGTAYFDSCGFEVTGTAASSYIFLFSQSNTFTRVTNSTFTFGATTQGIGLTSSGTAELEGCSSGTAITNLVDILNGGCYIRMSGCDWSGCASTVDVFNFATVNVSVTMRNCKMPTSWTGSINGSQPGIGSFSRLFNSDDGDINYALEHKELFGDIVHETTLVKSGGASDGTTPISWEMTTTANPEWPHQTLESPEIHRWFPDTEAGESLGVSTTIEIDILHDSVTNLQDDEVWIELQYLGTNGFPLSLFTDDAAATYNTTPADQAASTATWVTTGMTNPNKQKLSVSFTPYEAGFLIAKVKMAKASYTIYVDPYMTVSQ